MEINNITVPVNSQNILYIPNIIRVTFSFHQRFFRTFNSFVFIALSCYTLESFQLTVVIDQTQTISIRQLKSVSLQQQRLALSVGVSVNDRTLLFLSVV